MIATHVADIPCVSGHGWIRNDGASGDRNECTPFAWMKPDRVRTISPCGENSPAAVASFVALAHDRHDATSETPRRGGPAQCFQARRIAPSPKRSRARLLVVWRNQFLSEVHAVETPTLRWKPTGALAATARHSLQRCITAPMIGLISTFAVVAGVAGGALSAKSTLIIGAANLFADGLSMAVGNYLSIRSHEGALAAQDLPEEEAHPAKHGMATLVAFVGAGGIPLLPFVALSDFGRTLTASIALTFTALFTIGALRAVVTIDRWWLSGLEMLLLGIVVALAAYGSGAGAAWLLGGG